MRRPALIALVLVSVPLVGCATSAVDMAPDRPDAPWIPATGPDGEIAAGARGPAEQPNNGSYVLPSNRNLAAVPPPAADLERRRPYTLPRIDRHRPVDNPVTRVPGTTRVVPRSRLASPRVPFFRSFQPASFKVGRNSTTNFARLAST